MSSGRPRYTDVRSLRAAIAVFVIVCPLKLQRYSTALQLFKNKRSAVCRGNKVSVRVKALLPHKIAATEGPILSALREVRVQRVVDPGVLPVIDPHAHEVAVRGVEPPLVVSRVLWRLRLPVAAVVAVRLFRNLPDLLLHSLDDLLRRGCLTRCPREPGASRREVSVSNARCALKRGEALFEVPSPRLCVRRKIALRCNQDCAP